MSEATPPRPAISAEELRRHMAELEFRHVEEAERKRRAAEQAMADFIEHFTRDHLSEDEVEQMRIKARHAAERGLTEVMVMKFPSALCSDSGRAVNSFEADWPETLPGKAREFYELWDTRGRELGFKLKSMIIDFPDGKPGDVGLFISWAP